MEKIKFTSKKLLVLCLIVLLSMAVSVSASLDNPKTSASAFSTVETKSIDISGTKFVEKVFAIKSVNVDSIKDINDAYNAFEKLDAELKQTLSIRIAKNLLDTKMTEFEIAMQLAVAVEDERVTKLFIAKVDEVYAESSLSQKLIDSAFDEYRALTMRQKELVSHSKEMLEDAQIKLYALTLFN